ncbi:MAG TPA: branched-chain amino acid ABC transporter permease [Dehalococcoidia bacterium]|nr:branched-chain amino acid ABC transporter permease [Dehalococcoidia bacterium]
MEVLPQFIVSGIFLGAVYGVISLGYVLIYKATHVFNFSQGYFLMLGVLLSFIFMEYLPVLIAILLALAVGAAMGFIIHRLAVRPLIGQPLISALLMTLGLAYALQGLAIVFWGTKVRPYPHWFPVEEFDLGVIAISSPVLWGIVATAAIFVAVGLFYQRSKMGKGMRATAEDHQVAQSLGIKVDRVFTFSWVLAALLMFIGALFFGVQGGAFHGLSEWGWKAIPAVLVGGLDSLKGAIVGALLVGTLEAMATGYLGVAIGNIMPFIVLLLVLIIKPYGIFGEVRIERV